MFIPPYLTCPGGVPIGTPPRLPVPFHAEPHDGYRSCITYCLRMAHSTLFSSCSAPPSVLRWHKNHLVLYAQKNTQVDSYNIAHCRSNIVHNYGFTTHVNLYDAGWTNCSHEK